MSAALPDLPAADDRIAIVLYSGRDGKVPAKATLRWEQIADFLVNYVEESPCTMATCVGRKCVHKEFSSKPGNPMAWSPVEIDGNRLDVNVRRLTLLTLDFDHLSVPDVARIREALAPWEHVWHTTHNNRDEDPCFRAVLKLSRPVHANQWHRFLPAAIGFLGVTVINKEGVEQPDKTCKNRSRYYYRPSHPKDAPHAAGLVSGRTLDVDAILIWGDQNIASDLAYDGERRELPIGDEDWDIDGEGVLGVIDVASRYFPQQGRRNELCLALAGMLRRAGASQEIAEYIVEEIARQGGSDDPEGRAKTVAHTYGLTDENAMTGFTRVSEILGEDIAEEIGEHITDARNEALLRYFPVAQQAVAAAAGLSPPAMPAPEVAPIVDLAALRRMVVELAGRRGREAERDKVIDAVLLRRVLRGECLAQPGGEGDVETRPDDGDRGIGREAALRKVVGMMAFAFPQGTPWEAAAEILHASLHATRAPEEGTWLDKAEKMFRRSQQTKAVQQLEKVKEQADYVERVRKSVNLLTESYETRSHDPPEGANWQDILIKGKDGAIAQNLANAKTLLLNHPDFCGHIRWNEITKQVEIHGGALAKYRSLPFDNAVVGAQDYLIKVYGLNLPFRDLARRMVDVARDYPYDPLKAYLLSLRWDGVDRISSWLARYCGALNNDSPEAQYIRNIGKRWLIACAARGLNPGCKCDTMLILESDKQGLGKSTVFDILGGKWFSDTPIDIHNKDSRMMAALNWIIEMAELQSFKTADFLKMKAFLSQRADKMRPPYGSAIEEFLRRCVFAGTTNQRTYFTDDTGNRRYWSVLVHLIDIGALERDRDQMFAQAVHLYLAADACPECQRLREIGGSRKRCGEHRWWLSDEEEDLAAQEAEKREDELPWVLQIQEWWLGMTPMQRPQKFTTDDIATEVLAIDTERLNDKIRTQIGIAVKRLKFLKRRISVEGTQHWFYVPTEALLQQKTVKKEDRVKYGSLSVITGGKGDKKPGETN